jgi:hypothetical protein
VCAGSTKDEEGVAGGCGVAKELGGKFALGVFGVRSNNAAVLGTFSTPSEIFTLRVGFRGLESSEWPSKLFDLADRLLASVDLVADRLLASLDLVADRLLASLDLLGVFALIEERLECPSEKMDRPDLDRVL